MSRDRRRYDARAGRAHSRRGGDHGGSPLIALAIGLVALGFGIYLIFVTGPYGDGIEVEGRVLASKRIGERRIVFHQSEVEFFDVDTGRTHVVTSQVGSFFEPDVGDTRPVSYRPGDPLGARVVEGRIYVWLFVGMGLLFTGPSVHVLMKRARERD